MRMPRSNESACYFSWFAHLNLPLCGEEGLTALKYCTNKSWARFVKNLNLAYFYAKDTSKALEYLDEADKLLNNVPEELKKGFQLVLRNLERKLNDLPGGAPMPEDEEEKIGVLVVKALAEEAFAELCGATDEALKSALECAREACKLNDEMLLLKYLKAKYQWWIYDKDYHVSSPHVDCIRLFFEVSDELEKQRNVLDRKEVAASVGVAVAQTLKRTQQHFREKTQLIEWSRRQLRKVVQEDDGRLPSYLVRDVAFQTMYDRSIRRHMRTFFEKYLRIYPFDSQLIYFYGRFLYEVEKAEEEGERILKRAVKINHTGAIKGLVYLGKMLLKYSPGRIEDVEEMFVDFEKRVPGAVEDVVFLIHRGGFRYLIVNKKKEAFVDWLKAMEIDPKRQLITAYTQDWLNTGRNYAIRPADIMRQELPEFINSSSGEDGAFFKDAHEKVEDFFRSKEAGELEAETYEYGPAFSPVDTAELEELLIKRLHMENKVSGQRRFQRNY